MRQIERLLIAAIVVGLLAACICIARRVAVEAGNRTVEIAVDFGDVTQLAAMTERELPGVLADVKAAGVTSVAVYEDSLQSLVESGRATLGAGATIASMGPEPGSYLATDDLALAARVHEALAHKIAPDWGRGVPVAHLMRLPLSEAQLEDVGLGFPEEAIRQVQAAGLHVIARPLTYPLLRQEAIAYITDQCERLDARTLVFAGAQVMGDRDLLGETAEAIRKHGLAFGLVEMGKQFGDAGLGRNLGGSVIRVHSIPVPELAGMSPGEAVARFVRGVKERGIRLCYVRLFGRSGPDPYQAELDYLRQLADAIRRAGFSPGRAQPVKDLSVPAPVRALMALGIVAAALVLLRRVLPVSDRLSLALLVVGLALGIALALRGGVGSKGLALLAAVTFPTLAVHALAERLDRPAAQPRLLRLLTGSAAALLTCSGVTLLGGLMVAGLLATTPFMTHVDQFAGVKLAHGVPLLAIAAAYAFGLWRREDEPSAYWTRVAQTARGFWGAAVSNGHLVLAVVVLVMAALVIVRSGNEPGLEVSGLELRARQVLEDVLIARPRTKEFLVGHPLLVLASALAAWGWRRWIPLCVLGGAVGQVSLLNTFCHIHTPFIFSLIRSANGLWLGVVVGGLLVLALHLVRGCAGARYPTGGASGDASG
jgi:hypothetical protein